MDDEIKAREEFRLRTVPLFMVALMQKNEHSYPHFIEATNLADHTFSYLWKIGGIEYIGAEVEQKALSDFFTITTSK